MKKTSTKYIMILGVLTFVILGSQLLMQTTIKGSKSDARIINISGRQRMLSQKITKASLQMTIARDAHDFEIAKKELEAAFNLWSQSHEDLQYGSDEIDVSEMNGSNELTNLYEDIQPYFKAIRQAANYLINVDYDRISQQEENATIMMSFVKIITENESGFLNLMNKITFQYDKQASAKIENLAEVEYYLMGVTLLLILLEAFFIFRPMYADTKQKTAALSEINDLRTEEKTYASNQIKLANQRIRSLKDLALKLKSQLDSSSDEYAEKLTQQMTQYTSLSEEYEKVKLNVGLLQKRIDQLQNGLLLESEK